MKTYEEIQAAAKRVYIESSLNYIDKINSKQYFSIESTCPPINGLSCEMKKGERSFSFQADVMNRDISLVEFQGKKYGLMDDFILKNSETEILIHRGASELNVAIGNGFKSSGAFYNIESGFDTKAPCFHKAIMPFPKYGGKLVDYVKSECFNVGKSFRGAGYFDLKLKNTSIGIFDYRRNKEEYFFVECYDKISYPEFEKILGAVCYSYGLVSGSLVRDEVYILQSADLNFEVISGYQYRRIEDSLSTISAIAPRIFKQYHSLEKTEYMDQTVYSNLIQGCLNDERLLRALKIITESAVVPMAIRASAFSVALETVRNIIIEENQEKIKPIESDYAKIMIADFKNLLDNFDQTKIRNKESLIKTIENLNQIGNKDSFLQSFKLVGITLSKDEERCINNRNTFLHGRLPNEGMDNEALYLQRIVLKMHQLLCALILKHAGYSGHVINNMTYIALTNEGVSYDEPLFRAV